MCCSCSVRIILINRADACRSPKTIGSTQAPPCSAGPGCSGRASGGDRTASCFRDACAAGFDASPTAIDASTDTQRCRPKLIAASSGIGAPDLRLQRGLAESDRCGSSAATMRRYAATRRLRQSSMLPVRSNDASQRANAASRAANAACSRGNEASRRGNAASGGAIDASLGGNDPSQGGTDACPAADDAYARGNDASRRADDGSSRGMDGPSGADDQCVALLHGQRPTTNRVNQRAMRRPDRDGRCSWSSG